MNDKITIPESFCSEQVATDDRVYIKKENHNNEFVWAIYSPEGERMAQTFSKEMALAIVRQNDLRAECVH